MRTRTDIDFGLEVGIFRDSRIMKKTCGGPTRSPEMAG